MRDLRKKPRQPDDVPFVAMAPRRGAEVIYATHNFCDKTSWYSQSVRVTDEALTETDGTTYTLANKPVINLREGKVFDEEGLYEDQQLAEPLDPHAYEVVVKVDGVEQTQREPFADDGGDYHVDYTDGQIIFAASQAGKAVTASYSYASGSAWEMHPIGARALLIDEAEVQFTIDINYNTNLIMEIYGVADYFAPQLLTTADPPGPLPPGTPIPIAATIYKTVYQLIDEAVGVKPSLPVFTNTDPRRGPTQPMQIFTFRYTVARPMYPSLGMFTRIRLQNDAPFGGERATATFYMLSRKDPGAADALVELSSVE